MITEEPNSSHISDYKLQNKIGKGSFATVFKAIHIGTNRICAIKRIEKSSLIIESESTNNSPNYDEREVEVIKREIRILQKADHPLIVHFYETFEDEDYLYIVMEFIEGESMLIYVNSNGRLSEDQSRYFFKQLLSCVEYLHNELHVTHRDLKAENIIIDVHNNIRLIDFGLSSEENTNGSSNSMMQTVCGSPAYAAPELIQGQEYSNSVDIWSCGIVLYSMAFAALPFYDENIPSLFQKVVFEDPYIPEDGSKELANLILQILNKNPKERISIEKIKESPWFNSSGSNSSLNIDFSFLLDPSLRINNTTLSHDVLFQLRRLGYQIKRSPDDPLNETANANNISSSITSEDEILNDVSQSLYTSSITTAYRILNTSRVSQNVLKTINSFKYTSSSLNSISSDPCRSALNQFTTIGPGSNSYGRRRIRRNSSAAGCVNNKQIQLSPLSSPSKDIANSNSQSNITQNLNSNSNKNLIPIPNGKTSSNQNPNSDIYPDPNNSPNIINNFVEESIQNHKESFPSHHEVRFACPPTNNQNSSIKPLVRRRMSLSVKTSSGASIVVPKVTFTQTNI